MLVVHRSERADRLADALGDILSVPPSDPITPEVIAVPTRGVERWLSQRLSHRLGTPGGAAGAGGVCANVRFPFPGTLVGEATAAACGLRPDTDPWRPERAVWPLLGVVDEHRDDPVLEPLVAHLRATTPEPRPGDGPQLRRYAALRHLADLFDQYAVHRPAMVRGWLEASGSAGGDDAGDPTVIWQAHLWRLLRQRMGVPSPAERFALAAARLTAEPALLDLPERVALFGLTRLPASHLEVLQAVAAGREVHLFLLHPSGVLWQRIAGEVGDGVAKGWARASDPTARLPSHPLLRSWGRDAREMQLVLASHGVVDGEHRPVDADGREAPPTVLRRLQSDIRGDRRPPGPGSEERAPLLATDNSLQVHACHGRGRQVEVVRDAVLHLLAGDPTLEPRDVIVMCPDIESFAPLVHATFGAEDPGRGPAGGGTEGSVAGMPRLRVRLADRSLRQTNPLLATAAQLLELADGRVTASDVVDLAGRPPVARRFQLDRDDLATFEEWVVGTGVRWGLDRAHREQWRLGGVDANTWSAGLDRLLLGVAMSGEDGCVYEGTVPYDDVPSGDVELVGRVAELVSRLGAALTALSGPQTVREWADAVLAGTEALAVAANGEEWQHDQLRRVTAEVLEEASGAEGSGAGGAGGVVGLAEVRALLGSRLQGRPTRANFRTGDLTICTLVPMRSVPHRVVVLLGLDDGAFPRRPQSDGDDLLAARPLVGDRDPRSEDRQLLLDAVLSATDHLVITYAGRDERTNRPLAPAVPVAELLDVLDATFRAADGRRARDALVVQHPLQAFDQRNFRPGGLAPAGHGWLAGRLWGFDRVDLAGAASSTKRCAPPAWLDGRLPALDEPVVQLEDLIRFVEHPVRSFLRTRLGLFAGERESGLLDTLPIELDPLERWGVGNRMLDACLAGVPLPVAEAVERGRGLLPPGRLADEVLDVVRPLVQALLDGVAALGLPFPGQSSEVHVVLPGGRSLIGTVPNLRGGAILACSYSRLAPKHRLAAWVRFLALSAARPDRGVCAITIGRGPTSHRPPSMAVLRPLAVDADAHQVAALHSLRALVELRDHGMREPLPLFCATSAAWAAARHLGAGADDALRAAEECWKGSRGFAGEQDDPEHHRVWGAHPRLRDRLGEVPPEHERGGAWAGEPTRFGCLARRLWDDVLAAEVCGDVGHLAVGG